MIPLAVLLALVPMAHGQVTATLSGTVTDTSGSVIPNAKVTLTNDATGEVRSTVSNSDGFFVYPALLAGTYSVNVEAAGFKSLAQHGITLNTGDVRKIPNLALEVGAAQETVTVEASTQIIPVEGGQRAAILDSHDIQTLALGSRDLSELLKVLPGVTTAPNGLSNGPMFNFSQVSVAQSAVGNGLNANGVPNRGGTSQLLDGVDIDDPGCNCGSIALVNPDMTQEVSVQTSNFGADAPYGPVVINTTSKSGGDKYHGEAYLYARNDVLNANDWQSNHTSPVTPKGGASYYYPGGNFGGPFPFTHGKVRVWGAYERLQQNNGNTNVLQSFIPTPDMMSGNFTATAANSAFCLGAANINATQTNGCNDLTGTVLPDGTVVGQGSRPAGMIPSEFLDPGATALSSFWPKANANPATTPGNFNYRQVIPGVHNGWIYRLRADYNLNQNNSFFISYQQGYDQQPSQGNGAHIYWTPGNAIPYPGGGLQTTSYSKALAGHFVHIFSPTLTNEAIASWGYGNIPVAPPKLSAAYKSTLGYPYGTVFNNGAKVIPSYNSPGSFSFPDFSQADIFEATGNTYVVRKEIPAFADNVTKLWRTHTIKAGFYAANTGNLQGAFSVAGGYSGNFGSFGFGGTLKPNLITGARVGSPNNPTANFLMGLTTNFTQDSTTVNNDLAFQNLAFYGEDSWKATSRLTLEYGVRLSHIGHWYDRRKNGLAVFYPNLVSSDFAAGKTSPGIRWHGIDPSVPNSGQPDQFVLADPRFGIAYDLYGSGKTIIRGGWGIYHFSEQTNSPTAALTTAEAVQTYGQPGNSSLFFSQLSQITPPGSSGGVCCNGTVNALDPTDNTMPKTTAWNLTFSQQMPWQTLAEFAYVGNDSENLVLGGESISGSGFTDYTNQNKVPLGAFFQPDPVTGTVATNPEDVTTVGNKTADYRPYGYAYGDNNINVNKGVGYGNYHGLQLSWVKRSAHANFNVNYTWSKSLGTGLQVNPFAIRPNYGVTAIDRPHVFNFSGSYLFDNVLSGQNKFVRGLANGWTLSNITSWQAGGNLQAQFNNNTGNFAMSLQYATINGVPIQNDPSKAGYNPLPTGVGTGLSQATYYGTNASIVITPTLTCDPRTNRAHYQLLRYSCFAPPAIGQFGGQNYPYLSGPSLITSDLAAYKTFHITERHTVQFRASAFNWLNHPLPQFSGQSQVSLHYNADYASKAFTPNVVAYPNSNPNNFGVLDQKSGTPTQRVLELALKYQF
ncbi:MAG TPA: carboxypeptidase regulatory-like domain-containing protein [Pseudacidobacterium sp.]|nr:carboxypeptidase regulatory-like domain-containing protein [Pseudacidobacterium sp.]